MKLSIIIPAYNEEISLEKSIPLILKAFPRAELIVVNDGSFDRTKDILSQFNIKIINNEKNLGKGLSLKRGILAAEGELVIFTDADLPFRIEGIKKVAEALEETGANIAIAEKLEYRKNASYLLARAIVKFFIRVFLSIHFKDTQAGLKGFTKNTAKEIFQITKINRFASDIEILFLAKQKNFKVISLPLQVASDNLRPSSFNLKEGFLFLLDIIRIKIAKYDEKNY